jgi:D-alanyl-D-alanine dipeptidase
MRRPPLPTTLKFTALWSTLALLLFATSCQTAPRREPGTFHNPELVEVIKLDPTIRPDIRYATANNFTGHPLYTQPRAFLQRPAAEALIRAHRALQTQGYGILIYDAYRPWSVTKTLWDAATENERENGFVADPDTGSKHNRGCAVDVGLYDLKTGREVEMPSGYDEFSERAYPNYAGGPSETRRLRDLLRQAMETEGFEVSKNEWWHFNYRDWKAYRLLDTPFEDLPP